jgi:hypothetical protein
MYVEKNTKILWEIVGYVGLALCIIGQITVGKWYPFAQFAYLLANVGNCVRNFALDLPTANKVRDFVFTGITIGLIIVYFVK